MLLTMVLSCILFYVFRVGCIMYPPKASSLATPSQIEAFPSLELGSPYSQRLNNVPIIPMDMDIGIIASRGTETSAYWKSPIAAKIMNQIPSSDPPLQMRPLKWDRDGRGPEEFKYADDRFLDNEVMRTGAATVPASNSSLADSGVFAAGSAFRAARTAAML